MQNTTKKTNADVEAFNALHNEIKEMYPDIKTSIAGEINDIGELDAAYQLLTEDLKAYQLEKAIAFQTAAQSDAGTYNALLSRGLSKAYGISWTQTQSLNTYNQLAGSTNNNTIRSVTESLSRSDRSSWSLEYYKAIEQALISAEEQATKNDVYDEEIKR